MTPSELARHRGGPWKTRCSQETSKGNKMFSGNLQGKLRRRSRYLQPQNWPKSSQDPPKILPRPSPNPPRSLPKPLQNRSRRPLGDHFGPMLYKSFISKAQKAAKKRPRAPKRGPRWSQTPPKWSPRPSKNAFLADFLQFFVPT